MLSSEENRLELTLSSIYGKDLASLTKAIRAPRAPKKVSAKKEDDNNTEVTKVRNSVSEIREEFKFKILDIVKALKELLHAELDYSNFQAVLQAPKDQIELFLDRTASAIEAVDIHADLETSDNVALAPAPPLPNMYS